MESPTTVSATEAKQKLGQLIDKAQRNPVQIIRNGRSVAYLVSDVDFNESEATKKEWLEMTLLQAKTEFDAGREAEAEDVYARIRQKLSR